MNRIDELDRMLEALALEIAAIKKRGGSSRVDLHGGEYRGSAGGTHLYTFLVGEEVRLREDIPIRVTVEADEVEGSVVSVGEGTIVVALSRYMGNRILHARLVADDSFLLEALRKKLDAVRSGEAPFNPNLAARVLAVRSSQSSRETNVTLDGHAVHARLAAFPHACACDSPLNKHQQEALSLGLSEDVAFIWGPPGTGKTTVVAHIVSRLYQEGKSVLVVSNTNMAVDTALEGVMKQVTTSMQPEDGSIVRYPAPVKDELRSTYGHLVDPQQVVERRTAPLQEERTGLLDAKGKLERRADSYAKAITIYAKLAATEAAQRELRTAVVRLEEELSSHRLAEQRALIAAREYEEALARCETMGGLRRLLAGLNPDRLRVARQRALADAGKAKASADGCVRTRDDAANRASTSEEACKDLRLRVVSYPSQAECTSTLGELTRQIEDLSRRIAAIDAKIQALAEDILKNCRVMATTVYRTFLQGQVERQFDAVVIDEASMVALPMVFYVAGRANTRVVVAGDFLQLPAIVVSREPAVSEWIKRDIFRAAGVERALLRGETPRGVVALSEQHRMVEPICNVINDIFYTAYGNRLTTSPSCTPGKDLKLGEGGPLRFVDTGPLRPWTGVRLGSYSRYNLLHAILVRGLAAHLLREGYLKDNSLGVITPYAAQTALTQALLDEVLESGSRYASTVHRFQGNEKTTVILDLTDASGYRPSHFIQAVGPDEDGARLLNVALSRAQKHIILLADLNYLERAVGPSSIVGKVLSHFRRAGQAIDVTRLIDLGPDNWVNALHKVGPTELSFDPETTGVFTESTFYPGFYYDVLNAIRFVVVFSPFVTEGGTGRWTDLFRTKLGQGVKIRLVTRPAKDQGALGDTAGRAIDALRRLGVTVDLRQSMHEKVAVIDGQVLWHGSLNIMSHRDTSESMFRIPNPSVCEKVAGFVGLAGRAVAEPPDGEFFAMVETENPQCRTCGKPTIWKTGRYGSYFECESCGSRQNQGRGAARRGRPGRTSRPLGGERPASGPSKAGDRTPPVCPLHGVPMILRNGRYGPFYGCPMYPKCKQTKPG